MDCLGKAHRLGEVCGRNILHSLFSRSDHEISWQGGFERWEQEERRGVKGCLCGLVCTEKLNVKQYPMLVLRWGSQWHLGYLLNY